MIHLYLNKNLSSWGQGAFQDGNLDKDTHTHTHTHTHTRSSLFMMNEYELYLKSSCRRERQSQETDIILNLLLTKQKLLQNVAMS